MTPNLQILFNITNLIFYAFAGIGALVLIFKRNKPLAEELKEELQKYATKKALELFKAELQIQCASKHALVDKNFGELFKLDRMRTKEITDRLDAINTNLSGWQQTTESRLGNHDGRINNLEKQ